MHPDLALDLDRARQVQARRDLALAQQRRDALRHRSAHPPSPSRGRVALARSLVALAERLAPAEPRAPRHP
jgi:hypothetical protein